MELYKMIDEYREIQRAIEDGEIPEEAVADVIESVTIPIEEKVDNLATWVKELTGDINTLSSEIQNLQSRKKSKERLIESIKSSIRTAMVNVDRYKFEGHNRVSTRKSCKVVIDDIMSLMAMDDAENYLTYKDPDVNKIAIANALKSGVDVKGCRLEDTLSVQIK